MTPADTRRLARLCLGTLVGGFALAGFAAPAATAAPDCSPAGVNSVTNTVSMQAQAYLNAHPEGNRTLMKAALQPRPQAAATLAAYADANPQEYAEFKSILTPLAEIQNQCNVPVVPPQLQWAFDQFVGG